MISDAKEYPERGDVAFDRTFAMLVLGELVLFPGMTRSVDLDPMVGAALLERIAQEATPAIVVLSAPRPAEEEVEATLEGRVGTIARVLKSSGHTSGDFGVVLEGVRRVTVTRRVGGDVAIDLPADSVSTPQSERLASQLRDLIFRVVDLMPERSREESAPLQFITDPGPLADLVGGSLPSPRETQLAILNQFDVLERGELARRLLLQTIERLERRQSSRRQGFSELWPLAAGGDDDVARRIDRNEISSEEGARLRDYSEKGFTIWEGLVDPELIDELVADIRNIKNHPGCFLTTNHRQNRPLKISDSDFDAYESIFDLYVNFESARRVCFHPTILRFLKILFETKPVAFQQLLFQRSNQHPMHQDTAYVAVEEPLHLAATWIALEDVVPGRGELSYYEGSHRIAHYPFHDGSKRFDPAHDDEAAVREHILRECEAKGCQKRDFIAKKGDVFLWSGDLVHGSNPRTRPDAETRMSCVTHYCPDTTDPRWFWVLPDQQVLWPYGSDAYIASSQYRLTHGTAAREGMLRPTLRIDPI